jgi:hypothetical protein
LNAAPALFSTYADFIARVRTINYCIYSTAADWLFGNWEYIASGLNFINTIQEIIDLPGWVAGNNLALLLLDDDSASYREYTSWDNLALTEPRLYLEWTTAESIRGRTATCSNEVYFANKHNMAQITNAYYYDAAPAPGYTDIMAAVLPANLLPAVPAANDILYLGINTTFNDSGPFASVIFDIGTPATDIIDVDWQYWNGGWVALTVVSALDTPIPIEYFSYFGVSSVSFVQPSDWATTAVNGVTGYWIRCVVAVVGAAPTAPAQRNRLLYTVVRPSVDVDELQVLGDITALAALYVHDYTDEYHAKSVVLAIRSQNRGSNFRMYLNASDEQNITGIVFAVFPAAPPVMAANTSSPTGRCARYNPGAGSTGYACWAIDTSIANEYSGRYRTYLRVDRDSAITDCTVKLSTGNYDPVSYLISYNFESEIKTVLSGQPNYLIDFGVIDLPGFGALRDSDNIATIVIRLDFANTTANPNLYIYDLILVPVDEWAGEFSALNPENAADGIGYLSNEGGIRRVETYLHVDSINLKSRISAYTRHWAFDLIQYSWKDITAAAAQLQANKDQQVFAMLKTYHNTDDVWLLPVEGIGTLEIDAAARYLSMRGDR